MKNDCELRMDPIMDFEGLHCFRLLGGKTCFFSHLFAVSL